MTAPADEVDEMCCDKDTHGVETGVRVMINCPCGLNRCLPIGIQEGDVFQLVPCTKCGNAFRGRFHGYYVEQVGHDVR